MLQYATQLNAAGNWPLYSDVTRAQLAHSVTEPDTGFVFKAAELPKGGWCRLNYQVTVEGEPATITNTAEVTFNNVTTGVKASIEYSDAGGTGNGDAHAKVSVGDYVWFDSDRDGVQDANEDGIKSVTLTLTGPDGKPVTDVFGNPVKPVKTDENGHYLFENLPVLPAGDHCTVTVTPPAGYVPTVAGAGDPATDSSTGSATSTDLTKDGAKDLTLDFGFIAPINLVLQKKVTNPGQFQAGDTVTYALTPKNEGPGAALAGWSVTDQLPAGTTLVSISGEGYTCSTTDATRPTCVAAKGLAAGQIGPVVTVTVTINSDAEGVQKNVAHVTPNADDETNPLDVPTPSTDTDTSRTDNDAQAEVTIVNADADADADADPDAGADADCHPAGPEPQRGRGRRRGARLRAHRAADRSAAAEPGPGAAAERRSRASAPDRFGPVCRRPRGRCPDGGRSRHRDGR